MLPCIIFKPQTNEQQDTRQAFNWAAELAGGRVAIYKKNWHWLDRFYMKTKIRHFLFQSGKFFPASPPPINLCPSVYGFEKVFMHTRFLLRSFSFWCMRLNGLTYECIRPSVQSNVNQCFCDLTTQSHASEWEKSPQKSPVWTGLQIDLSSHSSVHIQIVFDFDSDRSQIDPTHLCE